MSSRYRIVIPRNTAHFAKRLAQPFSKRNLLCVTRTVAPMLFAFALSGVAHAQGTMDFSRAQTLMGTFNTTGICIIASISAAVPVRLMKCELLFVVERLASLLEENRLAVVARQHGIKKAQDNDAIGKLFTAYLRRAEESALDRILVELTIVQAATRENIAQVLQDAAAVHKVDTDAIALKVKQEFAAKGKAQTAKKPVAKTPVKTPQKTNAA